MKRLLQCMLLFGILFVAGHAVAQDVITLKDGTDVKAKVIEITTDEVKYKKENYLDGPTYTLSKTAILMIRYKDGDKDIFTNTSRNSNTTSQTATSDEEEILNMGSHGFMNLGFGWASLTGDDDGVLDNTLGSDLSFGFSFKPIVYSRHDLLLNFAFRFGMGTRGYSSAEDNPDNRINAFNIYISY